MHEEHSYEGVDNVVYKFRSLNLKESRKVESMISSGRPFFDIESDILDWCLLGDVDIDDMSPGDGKAIAELILRYSGISDANFLQMKLLTTRQELEGNIVHTLKSYVISAIPSYTDNDLDQLTITELIEKAILAESILDLQCRLSGVEADVTLRFEMVGEEEVEPEPQPQPVSKEELLNRVKGKSTIKDKKKPSEDGPSPVGSDGIAEDVRAMFDAPPDPNDPYLRKLMSDPKTQAILNR